MKKLFFAFAFLLCSLPARAQLTSVSGTAKDVNGVPYAGAQIKMQLVTTAGSPVSGQPTMTVNNQAQCVSSGFGSAPCQVPFQGTVGPFQASPTGTFTINLQDNTQVTPASTQWLFTINSTGGAPPIGTGPQVCITQVTISGSSQVLSLSSCPALSNVTGAPPINSPNSPIPGPPVFNVKNYGAFGDSQLAASASVAGTTITCATCNFSAATDVTSPLKAVFLSQGTGSFLSAWTGVNIAHIVSVTSPTTATTDIPANNSITGTLRWGRLDDNACTTVTAAAIAAGHLIAQSQQLGINVAAPTVYFPAGGYLLCNSVTNSAINLNPASNLTQMQVLGDGSGATAIYVGDGTPNPCPYSSNIAWFLSTSGNITTMNIQGFTVDGGNNSVNKNVPAVGIGSNRAYVHDLVIQHNNPQGAGPNSPALSVLNGGIYGDNIFVVGNGGPFLCRGCVGDIESGIFSNNGAGQTSGVNIVVQNVVGSSAGQGFRLGKGVLVDECSGNVACTQVTNSQDVWLVGPGLFGTTGASCLSIDGNSYVHFNGGLCGLFLTDTNVSGPNVAAGGVLEESDVRNISSGTGKCLTVSGTVLNNGANTCESLYTIASGSESVNTASLTVTTQGANVSANCSIGDTAIIEGVGSSNFGYNGKFKFAITAVGTNTVSYTNPTSGLSAIGAGGSFSCLNNRIMTGVPTQTLAPSQFNCNIPTLTATTTTATTNCFFTADRDIFVTRFSAGLGTTPATCTTAAVLQITNGTNSTNLTLTNAQAQDDSGAITGVLMAAGTKIGVIVQTAASGCGTSPANAAVNFLWMAAFDN